MSLQNRPSRKLKVITIGAIIAFIVSTADSSRKLYTKDPHPTKGRVTFTKDDKGFIRYAYSFEDGDLVKRVTFHSLTEDYPQPPELQIKTYTPTRYAIFHESQRINQLSVEDGLGNIIYLSLIPKKE